MKALTKFSILLFVAGIAASCSSGGGETTQTTEAKEISASGYDAIFEVNNSKSTLEWEGYKPTGQHNGTVDIVSGNLMMKDGNLVGGEFVMDLTSITVLDLTDPGMNAKLTDHLKSADFFEVETYPEARFEITSVKPFDGMADNAEMEKGDLKTTHTITGNLIVKGISKSITFNAMVNAKEGNFKAKTNMFFLDRTEWNVQYKSKKIFSNLKDNFINDEMGIRIKLVAEPQGEGMAVK
jgi:polyisoprenoid-binding protein YceI